MQVCGILAGRRIDEVTDNVFRMSSRINSTWGGSLVDMMRAQRYLEIIEEERLVDNAARMGAHLLGRIQAITEAYPALASNPRGRGLFCAFDLPSAAQRAAVVARAYERGLIILGCGERSIRFRPALAITRDELDEGLAILTGVLREQA
jgi:L-lysine 6-transaminase